jgi:hypothetical protein
MGRRLLVERDMQTRNQDLVIADKVQRTRHAKHLGTTIGNVGPRQQPGRLKGRTQEDRRGGTVGSVNLQKGREGSGDSKASQRSTATFQKGIGKQDGSLGRRQGRGADDGRCAAREDHGQKKAFQGESCQRVTRYRWNQSRGWQELGHQDDLADRPRGGQGGGHFEPWPASTEAACRYQCP